MRSAVNQAQQAATTAGNTAAGYNSTASGIGGSLIPFESRQLQNPSGMSQQDIGSQLAASAAGAGGATSGLQGAASKMGATTRNPMGFSSALDSAARQRTAAEAKGSEQIQANSADVKLNQQQQAGSALGNLYGMSSKAGAENSGQQASDINAQVNAGNSGWLQQGMGVLNSLNGAAGTALGGFGVGNFGKSR